MKINFSKKQLLHVLFGTQNIPSIIPGTILSIAVMLSSLMAANYLGLFIKNQFNLSKTLVSMFLLAIILGMAIRNTIKIHPSFDPGIQFCLAKLLRLGIIFLGIRLSLLTVAKIGIVSFFIAVICVLSGIVAASYLAKLFRVESRLGTLIAAGTSICGVSAIMAVSPCIAAREEETTYAISTITIFGLLVTLAYPYLVELVFQFNPAQAGIFLGTSIHETAQVTGAAYIYDQLWQTEVSQIAITTKLVRNMLMMAVIPILALVYTKKNRGTHEDGPPVKGYWQYFPKFILGFLAFAIFRSLGDWFISTRQEPFLLWSTTESWSSFYQFIKSSAKYILAISITAAGLSTHFSRLKKLSYKPFLIGLVAAVVVGGVSFILVTLLSGPIQTLLTGTS